jgi:hypothetical protein
MSELRVLPVAGMPEVKEGDAIGKLISERAEIDPGDIVVISQKIVSKAEGRVRKLSEVEPSEKAYELAKKLAKEPEIVELVLSESRELLREERVLITETHHGFVCANAGIDASNLPDDGTVCLLPKEPDASARRIRAELTTGTGGSGVGGAGHTPRWCPHPRRGGGGGGGGGPPPPRGGAPPPPPPIPPSRSHQRQLRESLAIGPGRGRNRLRRAAAAGRLAWAGGLQWA